MSRIPNLVPKIPAFIKGPNKSHTPKLIIDRIMVHLKDQRAYSHVASKLSLYKRDFCEFYVVFNWLIVWFWFIWESSSRSVKICTDSLYELLSMLLFDGSSEDFEYIIIPMETKLCKLHKSWKSKSVRNAKKQFYAFWATWHKVWSILYFWTDSWQAWSWLNSTRLTLFDISELGSKMCRLKKEKAKLMGALCYGESTL